MSCKLQIERRAMKINGVQSAYFDLKSEQLNVMYDDDGLDVNELKEAVANAGHYEMITDPSESEKIQRAQKNQAQGCGCGCA